MNLKKLQLSLAAVFTMIFTIMGSSVASASTLDYSTSLKRMQDLGIIDTAAANTSSFITRGQLAKSIVIAEGKASSAKSLNGSTIFYDVDPSSDLSGYINQGVNLGTEEGVNQKVICGRADGGYHPDDQVTYGELCTMMVRLLGYSDSDLTGAWPNNYIQKAADLDLTTDIALNRSDKVTLGVEAVMFDRLFDSTMKQSSTSSSEAFFSDNYYDDTTVTGTQKEVIVLANSRTSLDLAENQIITDQGTYTLKVGVSTPEIGGKYKMYVDGTTVTKVAPKINSTEGYAVSDVSASFITYTDDNNQSKSMLLPEASTYYYNGSSVSRDIAVKSIQPFSSVVIAKNSNGNNDYMVIADPTFSSPLVYDYESEEIDDLMEDEGIEYIYRDDSKYDSDKNIDFDDQDVVYKVSDLWGKNSCIYIHNQVVDGEITAITPDRFNPTSVVLEEESKKIASEVTDASGNTTKNYSYSTTTSTYTFSEYFNKSSYAIEELYIGSDVHFVLGIDGKILDVY